MLNKMLNIKKAIYSWLTFQIVYDILKLSSKEVKEVIIFENLDELLRIMGSDN